MSSQNARNRVRSPRFPSQSLTDSMENLKSIYDAVHASSIDSETAYQLMGFAGKSGSSAKALGSLRQFGLIEGVGDKTRVSDLAFAILEPSTSKERADAIMDAATNPDVFRDILVRFDDRVPQADEPIRAFLIRDLGFQKKSADHCIRSLRQSLSYAEAQQPAEKSAFSHEREQRTPELTANDDAPSEPEAVRPTLTATREAVEVVIIPLTKDCRAELRIEGKMSDRAISNLIKHIDLLAEVWGETDSDG